MSTELMSRRWRDSVRIARTNQGAMESGPEREIGIAEERKDDMKRLLLVGSLLLSAGAFTAGLVYGQGGRRAAVTPPAASLTSVQQSKIAEFKAAAMTKAAPMRAELQSKLVEIRKLFAADTPDRQAIIAKQTETEPIHRKLRDIWTDFALQVRGVLSPQQRAMWAETGWGMGPGMGLGPGLAAGTGMGHRGGREPGTGMAVDVGMCPFGCPMCPDQP